MNGNQRNKRPMRHITFLSLNKLDQSYDNTCNKKIFKNRMIIYIRINLNGPISTRGDGEKLTMYFSYFTIIPPSKRFIFINANFLHTSMCMRVI